jgi:dTDP-glucose pyrophosphorylase
MANNINILLPIAGHGSRFSSVGYELPKPLIQVEDKIIVEKSLDSIEYSGCNLIFIVRQEHIVKYQIDEQLKNKFGNDIDIISIEKDTDGAICSCLLAEDLIDSEDSLVIFTPDCYFEPKFNPHEAKNTDLDGVVAVFKSDSDAHSYVILDENGHVTKAAEKDVISTNAVGGMYYFKKGSDFVRNAKRMVEQSQKVKGEYYICPVYNLLIEEFDAKIGIDVNSRHVVLGTPEGLESYLRGEQ